MKHNYLRAAAVLLLFFVLAGSAAVQKTIDIAGKTYEYTGKSFSPIEGDLFRITIHEDGTFFYSESALSSYMGFGEWSVKGDVLTLTDHEEASGTRKNFFRVDGDGLIFIEDGSSNFIYNSVKDGERFTEAEPLKELRLNLE